MLELPAQSSGPVRAFHLANSRAMTANTTLIAPSQITASLYPLRATVARSFRTDGAG
jgi:hypothetical protein